MWLIAVPVLVLAVFVFSYSYWRIFLKPYVSIPFRCFLVHDVAKRPSFRSASEITTRKLRLFIDEAIDAGLKFVTPEQFFSREDRQEILLTVDDGLDSMYRHVYPILKEKRIPALVFLVEAYVGKAPDWDYRVWGRAHLTESQTDEMMESGLVTRGSHSATHPDLTRVTEQRLHEELKYNDCDSTPYFSYPFGRFGAGTIRAVKGAGFLRAFCSLNGKPALWNSRYAIPRMPLNRFDNRFTIRTKLRGGRLCWCEVLKSRIIGLFSSLTHQWRGTP
jgi:peptidoglycan/xylan/chitin deacetylase (PgdA/CDA1 family)